VYQPSGLTTLMQRNQLTLGGFKSDAVAIRVKRLNGVHEEARVGAFLHAHNLTARLEHWSFVVHVLHPNLHSTEKTLRKSQQLEQVIQTQKLSIRKIKESIKTLAVGRTTDHSDTTN